RGRATRASRARLGRRRRDRAPDRYWAFAQWRPPTCGGGWDSCREIGGGRPPRGGSASPTRSRPASANGTTTTSSIGSRPLPTASAIACVLPNIELVHDHRLHGPPPDSLCAHANSTHPPNRLLPPGCGAAASTTSNIRLPSPSQEQLVGVVML